MYRGGKGVNPREHSKLCDRGDRVSECSQQRGNLKDDGYKTNISLDCHYKEKMVTILNT